MILSNISNYSIVIWIVSAIIASFGLIIYIGGSNRSSRAFLLNVLSVAAWTASIGFFIASSDIYVATIFVKLAYFTGTMVGSTFFLFCLVYPENNKPKRWIVVSVWVVTLLTGYVYFGTNLDVGTAYSIPSIVRYGWTSGPLWLIFYIVEYPLFLGGLFLIFRTIRRLTDPRTKHNLIAMFISVMILVTPPTVMNVIMPQFGIFSLVWLGPIISIGWVSVVAFSVAKFKQLDIRTFTTEILNVTLVIIFFANIFTSGSAGTVGRILTFVIFLVISYYIIRLGAHVDDLNRNLKSKVDEQTKEIQGLYEVEKKARVELERLNAAKDQFILITQHHLRTPLAGIRWALESFKGRPGVDGTMDSDIVETLEAVEKLNHLLDSFLTISQMQAGADILSVKPASLLSVVESTLDELATDIKHKHIKVTYAKDAHMWPLLKIDEGKMKEVLFIVLQNAVAYNTEKGKIDVTTTTQMNTFTLMIHNTGIGIDPEEKKTLFTEMFNRGVAATKANPLGMGIGLTFARSLIEAHKGMLAIDSLGTGKGVTVTVTLPVA